MKEIDNLIRPELLGLKPYSSARSEFEGQADIFVDANENPFESGVNRYPDPLQKDLKKQIAKIKNVPVESIFLGNGSDEVLDLLIRLFCIPGKDEIIITPPTYGMYKVLADINNVNVRKVNLKDDFQLDVDQILKFYNRDTKILFLCSPNNPVGISFGRSDIEHLFHTFPGLIVVDEAYIDFSKDSGYIDSLPKFPRLVITQTLSKAWGLAGIRLGIGFCDPYIVNKLNGIKPPYNVNILTQKEAGIKLQKLEDFQKNVNTIIEERKVLTNELGKLNIVNKVHPSDANFLLVEFDNADKYFVALKEKGIIVRNRSNQMHCENCLRITVGTPEENRKVIETLKTM